MSSPHPSAPPERSDVDVADEGPSSLGAGGRSTWTIVAGAVTVQAMTGPGQTVGMAAFTDHLVSDLDLTRSSVATAYLVGTLVGALTLPVSGRFIDRRGTRVAVACFGGAFGASLVAMSAVTGMVTLVLGFAVTRSLGQGALTLAATTSVVVGVRERRGMAVGAATAVGGALMSIVPLIATVVIAAVGWRNAWIVLGVAVWVVLLPLAGTKFLAGRPSGARPLPVRRTAQPTSSSRRKSPRHRSPGLRSPAFWVVTAAVSLSALVATGLMFHHVSLMAGRGLSATEAAANFLPMTLAGAAAALVAGRLADRVSARLLVAVTMVTLAAAPLAALVIVPGATAVAYGVVLGASASAVRTVEATALPAWFGLDGIGALRGVVMAATVAASAFGPIVLALSADHLGGYRPGLVAFAASALVVAVLVVLTPVPRGVVDGAEPSPPGPGRSGVTLDGP